MIKLAIADDYSIFRDGIKMGLSKDQDLTVMMEAGNGEELLEKMENAVPDVILMDLKMPVMDGIEATVAVRKKYENVRIIIISMYDEEKFIIHLMEIGANGYLLKNADSKEIIQAIYSVHETGYYFNDMVNKALLKKLVVKRNFKPTFKQSPELTEREMDVLKLICEEKTNQEIGREMFLSPRSVEGIRQRLIEKIGVRNTAGLVMFAVKNGMV